MGFLQSDGIFNQASSAVSPCQSCRYTWKYQGILKKLSLVHTRSFEGGKAGLALMKVVRQGLY